MHVGNETEMLFVDKNVVEHTQLIWLAWAAVLGVLHLPGEIYFIDVTTAGSHLCPKFTFYLTS